MKRLNENLEKMRTHFDCLRQIEAQHGGNLNDPQTLREFLKRNCFLLGLETNKNKSIKIELDFLQKNTVRIRKDKLDLQSKQ